MPGYILTALQKLKHKQPARTQYAPHSRNKYVYGKHIQLATQQRSAQILNSTDKKRVQYINATFLYYAREVDPTMLTYLNKIYNCQSTMTQDTMEKCNQYLDYASTHTNTTIKYYASDMILTNDTYGTHIIILEASSRIEGHYYFAKQMLDYYKGNPTPNGPISSEYKTLKTWFPHYLKQKQVALSKRHKM